MGNKSSKAKLQTDFDAEVLQIDYSAVILGAGDVGKTSTDPNGRLIQNYKSTERAVNGVRLISGMKGNQAVSTLLTVWDTAKNTRLDGFKSLNCVFLICLDHRVGDWQQELFHWLSQIRSVPFDTPPSTLVVLTKVDVPDALPKEVNIFLQECAGEGQIDGWTTVTMRGNLPIAEFSRKVTQMAHARGTPRTARLGTFEQKEEDAKRKKK